MIEFWTDHSLFEIYDRQCLQTWVYVYEDWNVEDVSTIYGHILENTIETTLISEPFSSSFLFNSYLNM